MALPPAAMLGHFHRTGLPLPETLLGLGKIIKVRAVGVDERFPICRPPWITPGPRWSRPMSRWTWPR
ncbi:hypothetical protein [Actinomadura rudentiformis]|uniref:Uncharacterized protein n=1 Tax=Actinomadura rudentiformis TaxID=359158 RepID=A0A6H9YYJ6_9ACTN|nr:hypothetical protein [Actinomadura rudentiformis]KAB2350229.1 hypothetical protein F8566_10610 [Actinomadura rudentiformis]